MPVEKPLLAVVRRAQLLGRVLAHRGAQVAALAEVKGREGVPEAEAAAPEGLVVDGRLGHAAGLGPGLGRAVAVLAHVLGAPAVLPLLRRCGGHRRSRVSATLRTTSDPSFKLTVGPCNKRLLPSPHLLELRPDLVEDIVLLRALASLLALLNKVVALRAVALHGWSQRGADVAASALVARKWRPAWAL